MPLALCLPPSLCSLTCQHDIGKGHHFWPVHHTLFSFKSMFEVHFFQTAYKSSLLQAFPSSLSFKTCQQRSVRGGEKNPNETIMLCWEMHQQILCSVSILIFKLDVAVRSLGADLSLHCVSS